MIDPATADTITLELPGGGKVTFDRAAGTLASGKFTTHAPLINGKLKLRLLGDGAVLEAFAADGLSSLHVGDLPDAETGPIRLSASTGEAKIQSLSVHAMKSSWPAGR